MKKLALALLALGAVFTSHATELEEGDSKNEFKAIENKAFKPGEKLVYRLSYGIFDAGEAVLTVDESEKEVRGRKLWRVRGVGKTISAFEWFYKVNDRYESYMDAEGLFPWLFVRRVNEGGYKIEQDYTFFQHQNKVDNGAGKKFDVPNMVQDMISSFYFARTLDYDKAKVGDEFLVNIFLDDELYPTKIKYKGKEVIKTRTGKYRCHKFAPVVQEGRVFGSEDDLTVWITDDGNKIPIMAKANLKVGSMKMHLVEWEGLSNPMSKVSKR
ncbi:MAG: DUF3108 domain-containing protein [Crocinitomix sp.]|nr:DUF3108 domain-containing protein [Crocinitomix sp.]